MLQGLPALESNSILGQYGKHAVHSKGGKEMGLKLSLNKFSSHTNLSLTYLAESVNFIVSAYSDYCKC